MRVHRITCQSHWCPARLFLAAKLTHTFFNYRKEEGVTYTQSIEASLRDFYPSNYSSVDHALDEFKRAILTASKANIPAGHVRGYSSSFTPEIKAFLLQKKTLRFQLIIREVFGSIPFFYEDIFTEIQDNFKFLRRDLLDSTNFHSSSRRLGKLVSSLHTGCPDTIQIHEKILPTKSTRVTFSGGNSFWTIMNPLIVCSPQAD